MFARLDSGLGIGERNEDNNWTRTPQPVVVGTLRVTSFTQTNSGFVAQFNLPIDPAVLNLYSGPDPADVTFTDGEGNPVRGSLVLNATATQVTFIKTGGYFVTSTIPADRAP